MNTTDPIADLLTRIRNAQQARHKNVKIPASKLKLRMAQILTEEGYVEDAKFTEEGPQGTIIVTLRYQPSGDPVITGLQRLSKPGRRRYVGTNNIPKVLNGLGIAILSTSSGIMTDRQARRDKVGGELLCSVW